MHNPPRQDYVPHIRHPPQALYVGNGHAGCPRGWHAGWRWWLLVRDNPPYRGYIILLAQDNPSHPIYVILSRHPHPWGEGGLTLHNPLRQDYIPHIRHLPQTLYIRNRPAGCPSPGGCPNPGRYPGPGGLKRPLGKGKEFVIQPLVAGASGSPTPGGEHRPLGDIRGGPPREDLAYLDTLELGIVLGHQGLHPRLDHRGTAGEGRILKPACGLGGHLRQGLFLLPLLLSSPPTPLLGELFPLESKFLPEPSLVFLKLPGGELLTHARLTSLLGKLILAEGFLYTNPPDILLEFSQFQLGGTTSQTGLLLNVKLLEGKFHPELRGALLELRRGQGL